MGVSEEGDLLDFPLLKYNQYEMVWGGVSLKGLIPKVAPVFVSDLKKEWTDQCGQLGLYAYMVRAKAVLAVDALYGRRAVWQDDPACIHRDKVAIEACSVFPKRIPHERQALFASHQKMYEGIEMILKVQAVAAIWGKTLLTVSLTL